MRSIPTLSICGLENRWLQQSSLTLADTGKETRAWLSCVNVLVWLFVDLLLWPLFFFCETADPPLASGDRSRPVVCFSWKTRSVSNYQRNRASFSTWQTSCICVPRWLIYLFCQRFPTYLLSFVAMLLLLLLLSCVVTGTSALRKKALKEQCTSHCGRVRRHFAPLALCSWSTGTAMAATTCCATLDSKRWFNCSRPFVCDDKWVTTGDSKANTSLVCHLKQDALQIGFANCV